jgi:SAM-dependent MidA family methyltransferase
MNQFQSPLPFSAWMEQALFAPGQGYYSAHVSTVGMRGDFSTSATVSVLPGQAIARWLQAEMKRQPGVRAIIEIGGGNGELSGVVRKALGWWRRLGLHWHMVETSPILRQQQVDRLGAKAAAWHETLESALKASGGKAVIFHNELVDAFPVRLLQWNAPAMDWDEVWMHKPDAHWQEELRPLEMKDETRADFSALSNWHGKTSPPHVTQRIELHQSYRDWMQHWSTHWKAGAMLTIDYGGAFPGLYHRQPRGTLRAYWKHQRLTSTEVYERMGRQDLTTDVNFTDLISWGTKLGWGHEPLADWSAFLRKHLPRTAGDAALPFLTQEHGAGTAFQVLVQRPRGV